MGRVSCADVGFGVVVLRVLMLVRDVAVLSMEERSDVEAADVDARELREEGGRERGGGGGGGPSRLGTKSGESRGEVDAEPGGFGGRCGSFGGSGARLWGYISQSWETEETEGLTAEVTDRFSNDSSRLTVSGSRILPRSWSKSSRSIGKVAT